MCKVYEFPVKKELPKEIVDKLQQSANDYIRIINECLETVVTDSITTEEYNELSGMILQTYLEAIMNAVEKYE